MTEQLYEIKSRDQQHQLRITAENADEAIAQALSWVRQTGVRGTSFEVCPSPFDVWAGRITVDYLGNVGSVTHAHNWRYEH